MPLAQRPTFALMLSSLMLGGIADTAVADPAQPEAPTSGYQFMEPATRQLQDDDFLNPAFFLVAEGQALWDQDWPGATGLARSCRACHGDPATMAGVSASYPRYLPETGKLENVEARIRREIRTHFDADPPDFESRALIALTMLIGLQSRGLPMAVEIPPEAEPLAQFGQELFETRRGQLNLACKHCHADHWGDRLRGDVISQGQINAFPIFRLIWDEAGSLDRMFSWCLEAVRAEPYAAGSEEYRALELYLAQRGAGLLVETPGVRR